MSEREEYYVLKKKAVPEVLLNVVEAKKLLESGRASGVQQATAMAGISRSSFYKYKDDIFPFRDNTKGRAVTIIFQLEDEPGLLSKVLKVFAEFQANILTINQSFPVSGLAAMTVSLEILENTGDPEQILQELKEQQGVHAVQILARE